MIANGFRPPPHFVWDGMRMMAAVRTQRSAALVPVDRECSRQTAGCGVFNTTGCDTCRCGKAQLVRDQRPEIMSGIRQKSGSTYLFALTPTQPGFSNASVIMWR